MASSISKAIKNSAGFTLLELLIALLIFGLLTVMVVSGLRTMLQTKSHLERKSNVWFSLQWTLLQWEHEWRQIVAPPIRNDASNLTSACIVTPTYMEWTLQTNAKPNALSKRSNLQRVAYEYRQHQLIRWVWSDLERGAQTKVQAQILIKQLENARFYAWDDKGLRYTHWPVHTSLQQLPRLIEIQLVIPLMGEVRRLFYQAGDAIELP